MGTWACVDSNNNVANIIVADNEETALACSFTPRVVEYVAEENPVSIGWAYLENGQWQPPIIPEKVDPIIPLNP